MPKKDIASLITEKVESVDFGVLQKDSQKVALTSIRTNPNQPRRYFDSEKLQQLAASVKEHGIIEPILVRPLNDGEYELVAGERRYRAAKDLGLETVPVVVRELSSDEALHLALVENLQREDLNPIEETEGILQLLALRLHTNTPAVIATLYRMDNEAKGKVTNNVVGNQESGQVEALFNELGTLGWQSFVQHRLPLLNLPTEVLEALRQGKLAYTKARAIARLKDEDARNQLLDEAIEGNMSLNQIKGRAKELVPAKTEETGEQEQEPNLKQKFTETTGKLKKSKVWDDPKKRKKLESLLAQMEKVLGE